MLLGEHNCVMKILMLKNCLAFSGLSELRAGKCSPVAKFHIVASMQCLL